MIDYPCVRTAQDRDFGGIGNYYLIFVENVEKELTPIRIMEFLRKEVSVSCQAFVFPSLSSELCTRGNILLDSRKNFEKLCNFLDNPDQIIISSRGRYVLPDALLLNFSRAFNFGWGGGKKIDLVLFFACPNICLS